MKRQFTLIELLIIAAVLIVNAGLLLPAVSNAKEKAKSVSCTGNLKNINQYVAAYLKDNNNTYFDSGKLTNQNGWARKLAAHIQKADLINIYNLDNDFFKIWDRECILYCPDSKPRSLDETPGNGYHDFITGVSYQPITGWGLGSGPTGWPANKKGPDKWPEPAKLDQITAPAKTILFAEAQLASDPEKNPTNSNIYIGALKNRTFSKRHNSVNNILAVDGHVASIKSDDILKWFEKAPAWTRGNSNNYAECPLL